MFIHLAVLEVLTCGNTEIQAHNLQNVMNKLSTINPQKQISGFATEFEVVLANLLVVISKLLLLGSFSLYFSYLLLLPLFLLLHHSLRSLSILSLLFLSNWDSS